MLSYLRPTSSRCYESGVTSLSLSPSLSLSLLSSLVFTLCLATLTSEGTADHDNDNALTHMILIVVVAPISKNTKWVSVFSAVTE